MQEGLYQTKTSSACQEMCQIRQKLCPNQTHPKEMQTVHPQMLQKMFQEIWKTNMQQENSMQEHSLPKEIHLRESHNRAFRMQIRFRPLEFLL